MSQFETEEENISVIVRIKPEENNIPLSSIKIKDNIITIMSSKKEKNYLFDYIGKNSTQNDIFEHCGKNICDHALKGYNCTIFAYGQTGSGKTYTLLGKNITDIFEKRGAIVSSDADILMNENNVNYANNFEYDKNDDKIGLVSRILYYLFKNSRDKKGDNEFTFKMSYMEIYMKTIVDLLNPDNENLKEEPNDNSSILILKNLHKLVINSPNEAINYIINGNRLRHTAQTLKNIKSSRSHAIITIYIENSSSLENKRKKSFFHIIDLAGSESQKKAGVIGDRLKEAGANNISLLDLGRVIRAIINNVKHIPYRDSILTRILKDSIGGNSKTTIIATISQLESNLGETINTLEFAQDAKKIKNKARFNIERLKNFWELSIEKIEQFEIKFNSTLNEKENLYKSLEEQIEENKKIKNDILEKEKELKNVKEENINLKKIIEKDNIKIKANSNDLNNLKTEKVELEDKIKNLEEEIEINNKKLQNIEIQHKKEILDKEEKDKLLAELDYKINLLIKGLEKDDKNNKLQEEIEKLKEEIIKNNEIIKNIKKKHKTEISDIEKKNKELEDYNSKNDLLIKEIREKNQKCKQELDTMEKELNETKTELEKLNKELLDYKDKESNQNKKIEKMKKQIDALYKQNNQINQKYETSQKSIDSHFEKINSLSKHNNIIENKVNYIKKDLSNLLGSIYFDQSDCSKSINLFREIYQNTITSINNGTNIEIHAKNIQSLYSLGKQIIDNKSDKIENICDKLCKLYDSVS